jgi:hypothetical protein
MQADRRDAAVRAFGEMVERARLHDGCLDVSISAVVSARAMAQTIAHWPGFTPPRGRHLLRC